MKKLFICLLCVNLITFYSFSLSLSDDSDLGDGASQKNTETIPANVQITETKPENEKVDSEIITDLNDQDKEQSDISQNEITADRTESKSFEYPEPEELEEPNITTLEPEPNEKNKEELVDTELPPLGEQINGQIKNEESDKTKKQVIENETEIKENLSEVQDEPAKEREEQKTIKAESEQETEENKEEQLETVSEEIIEPTVDIITPSRSVIMKKREYIDITYPGTGWIYIGIVDGSKDLSYFGRALGTKDTTFTLQAKVPGTKVLHFCKNDYLTGEYIDDYIEIQILAEEGSNKTHIEAPEYKQPEPAIFSKSEESEENEESVKNIENNPQKEPMETIETKEDEYREDDFGKKSNKNEIPNVTESTSSVNIPENKVENKQESNEKSPFISTPENNTNKKDIILDRNIPAMVQENNVYQIEEDDEIEIPDFGEDDISIPEEEVIETTENSDTTDCKALLKEANFLYNEKEFQAAYEKVNKYLEFATTNIDEGLLLKGKILEAKSELQDIKAAIKIYNTLMKEYPASSYWEEANKRVIYLKRFYLEVR